jgi:hypothetical protein
MKTHAVTTDEAERMFRYWRKVRNDGGISAVARKFSRHRKTIYKIANRDDWHGRDDRIKAEVRQDQDKKEVQSSVRTADECKGLCDEVLRRIRKLLKDGKYNPTISDYVQLTRLYKEMVGELPGAGAVSVTVVNGKPELQRKRDDELVEFFREG